jgi:hypothetical protein
MRPVLRQRPPTARMVLHRLRQPRPSRSPLSTPPQEPDKCVNRARGSRSTRPMWVAGRGRGWSGGWRSGKGPTTTAAALGPLGPVSKSVGTVISTPRYQDPGVKRQPLRLGLRWLLEATDTWWYNNRQPRRNTDRRARHRHAAHCLTPPSSSSACSVKSSRNGSGLATRCRGSRRIVIPPAARQPVPSTWDHYFEVSVRSMCASLQKARARVQRDCRGYLDKFPMDGTLSVLSM